LLGVLPKILSEAGATSLGKLPVSAAIYLMQEMNFSLR
jgi:hypothetical protein